MGIIIIKARNHNPDIVNRMIPTKNNEYLVDYPIKYYKSCWESPFLKAEIPTKNRKHNDPNQTLQV